MEHESRLPATHAGACKSNAILLSYRTQPSRNGDSSTFSGTPGGSNSYYTPPNSRSDSNPKKLGHHNSLNYPAHQGDVIPGICYSQERSHHIEGSECEVGDCHNKQLPGAAYCKSHICGADSCGDIRALGSRYCLNHKCRSCNTRAEIRSSYCKTHKCRISSCARSKAKGQEWCKHHACSWPGCAEAPARGARHCRDHACAAGDCGLKVLCIGSRLGNYCCCHTCSADGCLLRVSWTGAFCADHECPTRGCPNPRLWDDEWGLAREHECCRFHTCVQRGCFTPTTQIGTLCDRHFDGTCSVLSP
ncbi:hypothetical protein F5Y12DRAFT_282227 [Xylaria sp. FL1777]|nr:hypothetical protein F5Y12DRAFT_282227 [Xylaria sp. FL1777]